MIRSQAEIGSRSFNNKITELIRFSSVGVINTLIDFTVFTFLTYALSINISFSQAAGYGSGVINSFIMNRSWTFKQEKQGQLGRQLVNFIIINVISLGLSSVLIGALVNSAGISVLVAKLIVTLVTQAINYLGYKRIVFK